MFSNSCMLLGILFHLLLDECKDFFALLEKDLKLDLHFLHNATDGKYTADFFLEHYQDPNFIEVKKLRKYLNF
jgi:hypothetical protein